MSDINQQTQPGTHNARISPSLSPETRQQAVWPTPNRLCRLYATYTRIPRDVYGRRRYLIDYTRSDGEWAGFECITVQHLQSTIDAVYPAAERRAAAHGLALDMVARRVER